LNAALTHRSELLGEAARDHSHWVFPVLVENPSEVVSHLRAEGFDATTRSSFIAIDEGQDISSINSKQFTERVVFLPIDYPMTSAELDRLGNSFLEVAHLKKA